ncbi:MAG: hypothetical protein ACREN2_05140, partial [Candidatus Dormibacteria bacterium]
AGFFTGDAGHVVNGQAGGNFDGVALHLTYLRDVVDLALAGAFVYAGWFAGEATAKVTVLSAGAALLLLAAVGFIVGDTNAGDRGIATLHFPIAINIFDLIAGVLAVICALSLVDEVAPAAP